MKKMMAMLLLSLASAVLGQLDTPDAKKIWHASFDGDLGVVQGRDSIDIWNLRCKLWTTSVLGHYKFRHASKLQT